MAMDTKRKLVFQEVLLLKYMDRDLYEHRISLSEPGNSGHLHFFLLERSEPPVTLGIIPLVATCYPNSELLYAKKCSDNGEFSIECVWEKRE